MPAANPMEEFPTLKTWAVVGVSADASKYGNKIYLDLRNAGYTVYGVNPKLETIEGDPCYPSLAALPVVPEVVNVVVPPQLGEQVVQDCLDRGITRIWFQPGAESESAVAKAEKAGMAVVHDACIMLQKQVMA
ncbi:MAG: CoA-binding protein [Candidatus Melainabacteria bacterium]